MRIVNAIEAATKTVAGVCGYCGGEMPPGSWILQEGWCPCGRRRIESLGDGTVRIYDPGERPNPMKAWGARYTEQTMEP